MAIGVPLWCRNGLVHLYQQRHAMQVRCHAHGVTGTHPHQHNSRSTWGARSTFRKALLYKGFFSREGEGEAWLSVSPKGPESAVKSWDWSMISYYSIAVHLQSRVIIMYAQAMPRFSLQNGKGRCHAIASAKGLQNTKAIQLSVLAHSGEHVHKYVAPWLLCLSGAPRIPPGKQNTHRANKVQQRGSTCGGVKTNAPCVPSR